jgi:hypothetical protein
MPTTQKKSRTTGVAREGREEGKGKERERNTSGDSQARRIKMLGGNETKEIQGYEATR